MQTTDMQNLRQITGITDIMTNPRLRDAEIVRLSRSGLQGAVIGRRVGLTRARISQILKRANQPQATKRGFRACAWCGTQFLAFPCQTRKYCSTACVGAAASKAVEKACLVCSKPVMRQASRPYRRAFCSQACYHSLRQDGRYRPNRQGQRIARKTVSQYFDLQPQHVVHHEDRDTSHNDITNLLVFASQADHMAYHHGSDVKPLWDGREFSQRVTL